MGQLAWQRCHVFSCTVSAPNTYTHQIYDLLLHSFRHTTYKRGVLGLVYVEMNIVVCSQCLLLLKLLLLLLLLLLLREEEAVCGKSNGDRTGNVHSPSFHDHRWNGG